MSNPPDDPDTAGPRQRHVEMGVAAFMLVLGVITIIGSLQVGIGWGGGRAASPASFRSGSG